ncbi:MAG: hypothetical protein HOQ05_12185 [Corynebacteriales bacterium]|nr:hypothetical protein [Mycobacteriales bacterium]
MKLLLRVTSPLIGVAFLAVAFLMFAPASPVAAAEPGRELVHAAVNEQTIARQISEKLNVPVEEVRIVKASCQYADWFWYWEDCMRAGQQFGQQTGRSWGCIQSQITFVWNLYVC